MAWWLGGNPFYGNRVSLASVTDGTSNTAAFSEWVKGKSGQNSPGLNLVYTIAQYTNGGPQNDVSTCTASNTPLWDFKGEYWTLQDSGRGGPYYHVMPPDQPACAISAAFGNVDSFIGSELVSPGRCERAHPGWVGSVRQSFRRPGGLERTWVPGAAERSSQPTVTDRGRRCVCAARGSRSWD